MTTPNLANSQLEQDAAAEPNESTSPAQGPSEDNRQEFLSIAVLVLFLIAFVLCWFFILL